MAENGPVMEHSLLKAGRGVAPKLVKRDARDTGQRCNQVAGAQRGKRCAAGRQARVIFVIIAAAKEISREDLVHGGERRNVGKVVVGVDGGLAAPVVGLKGVALRGRVCRAAGPAVAKLGIVVLGAGNDKEADIGVCERVVGVCGKVEGDAQQVALVVGKGIVFGNVHVGPPVEGHLARNVGVRDAAVRRGGHERDAAHEVAQVRQVLPLEKRLVRHERVERERIFIRAGGSIIVEIPGAPENAADPVAVVVERRVALGGSLAARQNVARAEIAVVRCAKAAAPAHVLVPVHGHVRVPAGNLVARAPRQARVVVKRVVQRDLVLDAEASVLLEAESRRLARVVDRAEGRVLVLGLVVGERL